MPTALTLNVNNDGSSTADATIKESDQNPAGNKGQYTTLNVVTQGAQSSNIALSNFNALTILNVSGNSAQSTLMLGGLPTSLTSITDSSSGVVNVVMPSITTTTPPSTTASFNGSAAAGQEIVTITQPLASTASIQGGTATNNTLVISTNAAAAASNFTTDTVQGVSGIISSFGTGTISGFEVVGINDSYGSGSSGNSFDIAALGAQLGSSFNNTVDLQTVTGTDTLYNLANNSTLQFDSGVVGTINSTAAVNSMNIVLNGVTGPAINLSSGTGAGAAILNIQDTANGGANSISTLTDNTLTTLNITANNALTISTLYDNTTSPVAINLSGTGAFTLTTNSTNFTTPTLTITDKSTNATASIFSITDSSLNTLNLAGTHNINISALDDNATSLTIQDNSTNAVPITSQYSDRIGTLTSDSLASLTFTGSHSFTIDIFTDTYNSALFITNSGTGSVILGASGTSTSAFDGTSLTLAGNVGLGSYSSSTNTWSGGLTSSASSGFTLAGATDNANVNFSLTDSKGVAVTANHTNTVVLGNGNNSITIDTSQTSNPSSAQTITNNVSVGSGNNTITFKDFYIASGNELTIKNNVTLNAPNQDINHFTAISDTNSSGGAWSDLVLTFSNTINPNNSSASTIAQAPGTGSTFLADLNQAIVAAASLTTSPFAYFTIADNLIPGHPGSTSGGSSDAITDTVIVDHSSANTGTTFVPGQDAFIVLVGTGDNVTASVASGAIHVTVAA